MLWNFWSLDSWGSWRMGHTSMAISMSRPVRRATLTARFSSLSGRRRCGTMRKAEVCRGCSVAERYLNLTSGENTRSQTCSRWTWSICPKNPQKTSPNNHKGTQYPISNGMFLMAMCFEKGHRQRLSETHGLSDETIIIKVFLGCGPKLRRLQIGQLSFHEDLLLTMCTKNDHGQIPLKGIPT